MTDKVCLYCGRTEVKLHRTTRVISGRRRAICDRCAQSHGYRTCPECVTLVHPDRTYKGKDTDQRYCAKCFGKRWGSCRSCGTLDIIKNLHRDRAQTSLCKECFPNYVTCARCKNFYGNIGSQCVPVRNPRGEVTAHLCINCNALKAQFRRAKTFKRNKYERMVGTEIEYISNNDVAENALKQFGQVKGDGSLRPENDDEWGAELTTYATNGDALFENVEHATSIIRDGYGHVNRSCGFHVHLDMRAESKVAQRNIWRAWYATERTILSAVPESRRRNEYCHSVHHLPLKLSHAIGDSNRYNTLNPRALSKFGSFEVRVHQGSLQSKRLIGWLTFLLAFFETFKNVSLSQSRIREIVEEMTDRERLHYLLGSLDLSLATKKLFRARISKYGASYVDSRKITRAEKLPEHQVRLTWPSPRSTPTYTPPQASSFFEASTVRLSSSRMPNMHMEPWEPASRELEEQARQGRAREERAREERQMSSRELSQLSRATFEQLAQASGLSTTSTGTNETQPDTSESESEPEYDSYGRRIRRNS